MVLDEITFTPVERMFLIIMSPSLTGASISTEFISFMQGNINSLGIGLSVLTGSLLKPEFFSFTVEVNILEGLVISVIA
jgi:hypothetical protein